MDRLETELIKKREEWDRVEAPAEMQSRLRHALERKKRRIIYKPVAAVLIAVLLLTYSFDALAYYGKKFTGYDQVALGSLKQLNEEGQGQTIGKCLNFSNGVEITVDGIMFDENELVVFYKVHSSRGNLLGALNSDLPRLHLYGLKPGGYHSTGGHGLVVDDRTMTFVDTLEPPRFYEKWMRLSVELGTGSQMEDSSINFTLDRNLAMKRTVKLDLHSEAKLGEYNILFEGLTASTMSTVIEGRIIPLTGAAMKAFKAETAEADMEIPHLHFNIVSDTGEISQFTSGQSVSGSDISFDSKSDALPRNSKTLQIRNIRFDTMKQVDKTVNVELDTKNLRLADDLTIKRVYRDGTGTCVVIASRGVPVVGLFEGDKQLEQVNSRELDPEAESTVPVERIYRFNGTGSNLELAVKYILYSKYSADTVNIPVK